MRKDSPYVNAKFIKVICKDCNAVNVLFSRATMSVRCPECRALQTVPKGGKCKIINCTSKEELA